MIRLKSPIWSTVAVLAPFAVLLFWLSREFGQPQQFDDSLMFYRYAINLRHGLGMSWNPDGIPTYGLTSQTWILVIGALSLLPLPPDDVVRLGPAAAAALSLGLLAWFSARRSVPLFVAPLFLIIQKRFAYHATTRMDTMASFAALLGLSIAAVAWAERPSARYAWAVAGTAILAILTRPENAVAALGLPACLIALSPRRSLNTVAIAIGAPVLFLGIWLWFCHAYYGSALPLSFYAKNGEAYVGFMNPDNSFAHFISTLRLSAPALLVIGMGAKRDDAPVFAAFVGIWGLAQAYLLTVHQIMGMNGRFYIPWLALLYVPAILAAPAAWVRLKTAFGHAPLATLASAAAGAVFVFVAPKYVPRFMQHGYVTQTPVAQPSWKTAGDCALPHLPWFTTATAIGNHIVPAIGPGGVVAATEVGRTAVYAPNVTVIDLAGLNDTMIALHGFNAQRLLSETKPDMIWFPHNDYTGLRASLLSNQSLAENYDFYPGAFEYGLAVRHDSRYRDAILKSVAAQWAQLYPGHAMQSCLAQPTLR